MRHRSLVPALIALILAGCASAELRPLKPEERRPLAQALDPLLRAAYGADVAKCRIATVARDDEHYDAYMGRRGDAPCDLTVVVTTPILTQLQPKGLQTLLAHELAHVRSEHAAGGARESEIRGRRSGVLTTSNEQFKPDEEAAADAEAARLLTLAWRGSNVGCLALADLYEDIAKDRSRWGRWLSRHPFPERRVEAVVKACESEQRRPR